MISIAIFLFSALVLYILGARSVINYRKSAQNFIAKGFIGLGFLAATGYLFLALDGFFEIRGLHQLSAWADTGGTVFVYLSMFPSIWMASRFLQRPQFGKILQVLVGISGVYVTWVNLFYNQTTYVSKNGIITYVDGGLPSLLFAATILVVYNWVFGVFIWAGMKNAHIRVKLFTLGIGFLISTWSGAFIAAIPHSLTGYLVGYGFLLFSYILQFIGVLM